MYANNNPGKQLAALRRTVTQLCIECGSEFTGLAAKKANKCQKCRRREVQAAYRAKQHRLTGEQP